MTKTKRKKLKPNNALVFFSGKSVWSMTHDIINDVISPKIEKITGPSDVWTALSLKIEVEQENCSPRRLRQKEVA